MDAPKPRPVNSPLPPIQGYEQAMAELTNEQAQLAYWFSMPKRQGRPLVSEMAKRLHCSEATIYNIAQGESFHRVRAALVRAQFIDQVPDVVEAVKTKALQGDTEAARLFLKWARELEEDTTAKNNFYGNVTINYSNEEVEEKLARLRNNVVGEAEIEARARSGDGTVSEVQHENVEHESVE